MESTTTDIQYVARRFVARLRNDLTTQEFNDMRKANAVETNPYICHSHDYVDANEYMLAAIKDHCRNEIHDQSDWFIDLWNAAWSLAKSEAIGE